MEMPAGTLGCSWAARKTVRINNNPAVVNNFFFISIPFCATNKD
jgi:hypothetical protein